MWKTRSTSTLLTSAPKTVVVTGATSGVGEAIAAQLAARGHRVIGVARTAARAEAALARCVAARSGPTPEFLLADLSILAEVRRLAAELVARTDRVDVLILNAAVARPRREMSADGYEMDFATNHLSAFLLARLLDDRLRAGAPARVVTLSSSAQRHVKTVDLEAMVTGENFHHLHTYSATKLLTLWFTTELARRLAGTGVTANAADPGFVRTGLGRDAPGAFGVFLRVAGPFQSSPAQAAITPVRLATSGELDGVTGRLFAHGKDVPLSELAHDRHRAEQLWELSSQLCGLGQ